MTRARALRIALPAAACAAVAALIWALYGTGNVGYDTYYALIWGDELSEGTLPSYEAPRSPIPHPLANLVSLVVTPLGNVSDGAWTVITLLSFGALAVAAFYLGRALVAWPVGVVFAIVLLTRPLLVEQAMSTSIDIPFLALIVAAAAVEVRKRGNWLPVLLLLGAAGLLRPEAWGVSAFYILWTWRIVTPRERKWMVGIAAAAPVIWMGSDLIITGSPKWSFDQGRLTAERTGTPGGLKQTISWTGRAMKGVLHLPVAFGGIAGVLLAIRFYRQKALAPLGILALGAASFLAIGFAGLPLITRYFFLGGVMLGLFFAVALVGWTGLERDNRWRAWWIAGAAVLALVMVATAKHETDLVQGRLREASRRGVVQDDLERLMNQAEFNAAIADCKPLYSRVFRSRPQMLWLRRDKPAIEIVANQKVAPTTGLLLRYVYERAPAPATGFHNIAASTFWSLSGTCPPRAVAAGP